MTTTDNGILEDFDVDFDTSNKDDLLVEEDILSDMDIDFDDDEISDNESSNTVESEESEDKVHIENNVDTEQEKHDSHEIVDLDKNDNVEESLITKSSSKKKKKFFSKEDENTKPIDLILYIIADKANVSMTSYCRNYGANVSKVFTNIKEARDSLLMQVEPFRVIIIDSGTGRFTNMGARKELIDLLGICDVDTRITVFYTDSAIKTDVELADGVEDKEIKWYKYKSTPDIVAHILQNSKKEHYILDVNDYEEPIIDESILNFKGLELKKGKQLDLGKPTITPDDVILHMMNNESTDGLLTSYNIKINK